MSHCASPPPNLADGLYDRICTLRSEHERYLGQEVIINPLQDLYLKMVLQQATPSYVVNDHVITVCLSDAIPQNSILNASLFWIGLYPDLDCYLQSSSLSSGS
jgi:hypothetical protein